jgi:hypothetical protein
VRAALAKFNDALWEAMMFSDSELCLLFFSNFYSYQFFFLTITIINCRVIRMYNRNIKYLLD